jgi:integrase
MKVRKEIHHGKARWIADGGSRAGKRRRKRHDTKKAAEKQLATWAAEDRAAGDVWLTLPPKEKAEVLTVLGEIEKAGLSVREVWEGFKSAEEGKAAIVPISLSAAITAAVAEKRAANRRSKYLVELKCAWEQFAGGKGTRPVHEITVPEVKKWIFAGETAGTRNTRRNRLNTFFKWALKQRHTRRNPVEAVEKITVEYGKAAVFSAAECKRLMDAAWKLDVGAVGELALMVFAGVRPAETQRLTPEDVDLSRGRVRIEAAAAKLRDRRIVELEETALVWLRRAAKRLRRGTKPARSEALHGFVSIGKNRRRRLDRIRKEAKLLKVWPHDVLRHTAASHLFLKLGAAETARRLGHSEGMLFKHYRDVVTPEESKEFWKIAPPKKG